MSPMLTLRSARPNEAAALTELCLRSKAVWGYDDEFMLACHRELTLTPENIRTSDVQVAEADGKVVGVAQITLSGKVAALDKLFVEPRSLRSGAGRMLFAWAKSLARQAGAAVLVIESDPGAAPFYRRMGAIDDGIASSGSIPGRFIARLRVDLVRPAS
jgi:N-acetylglutamate synthase-like GNAT family acetyltransferase